MPAEPVLLAVHVVLDRHHDEAGQEHVARLVGRLGLPAVVAPADTSPERLERLSWAASPAAVHIDSPDLIVVSTRDPGAVRAARVALDAAGRQAEPVVVRLPVAIGRTLNEAVARAERDPRLATDPQLHERGLFGTFEQAQDQVLALAAAGAGVLQVVLADELDMADLLAQVRALVVGATPVLHARS